MHQGILQLIRSQLSDHSLKRGYRLQSLDYRVKLTEYLQVLLILSHWLVFLSKRDLPIHLGFCTMFFFFFFLKKGFCFLENGRVIFVSVFFFFLKIGYCSRGMFYFKFSLAQSQGLHISPSLCVSGRLGSIRHRNALTKKDKGLKARLAQGYASLWTKMAGVW